MGIEDSFEVISGCLELRMRREIIPWDVGERPLS